jgi:drug/metabolite transporter (DMT)-like permease
VYGVAVIISYIIAVALHVDHADQIFDWTKEEYTMYVLWLAVVPGFFGQPLVGYMTDYLPILLVSLATSLEPIFGSMIAWWYGLQPMLTVLGSFGCILILAACFMTVVLEYNITQKHKQNAMHDEFQYYNIDDLSTNTSKYALS